MRGKGFAAGVLMPACGITPAYAGKSWSTARSSTKSEDHPRLCGEKLNLTLIKSIPLGSPPPMRGKEAVFCDIWRNGRITPAYAGKSSFCVSVQMCTEDHPRLCGEKSILRMIIFRQKGSPPPMRGKVINNLESVIVAGDHPRLCGEKIRRKCFYDLLLGSPPPMRGKGRRRTRCVVHGWITPAYAGKRRL